MSVVRFLIEETPAVAAPAAAATASTAPPSSRWRRAMPWAVAAASVALAVSAVVLWSPWQRAQAPAPLRLSTELGADVEIAGNQAAVALSPDGRPLAFVGVRARGERPQLFMRRLEQLQATAMAGTEGAFDPFFSPDGQWIAFFADARLKKISVTGSGGAWDGANVVVQPLPDGERKILQRGGYYARYVPSGHLTYIHEGTFFAAPFDIERLELTGQPVPVVEGVASYPTGRGGSAGRARRSGSAVHSGGSTLRATSRPSLVSRARYTWPMPPAPASDRTSY